MSIFFHRVPRAELGTQYQHVGWMLGLVPVYIGDAESSAPLITERNGVPTWWFDLVLGAHAAVCWLAVRLDPDFAPCFAFTITGELRPER